MTQPAEERFAETYGVFFATVAFAAGAALLVLRLGLPTPMRLVVLCSSLLAAAALVPACLKLLQGPQRDAVSALAVLLVLASPALGLFLGAGYFYLYPISAIAMLLFVLWRTQFWSARSVVRGGLLAAAVLWYVLCAVNDQHYASLYAPEELVLGQLNRDTTFHTAIANLMLNYGVVSLGMDGLLPLSYHVLSHWWFTALALLGQAEPVYAYMAGTNIVLVPALLMAIGLAARAFVERAPRYSQIALSPVVLLFLSDWFGSSNLISGDVRADAYAYGWSSYLISESYTAALIGLVLALPLLLRVARGEAPAAWMTLVALLAIPVLSLLKFSVGLLWAVAWAWAVLRSRGLNWRALLEVALSGATALAVVWLFAPTPEDFIPKDQHLIVPFYFFKIYPEVASYSSLVIPFALVALRLRRLGASTVHKVVAALRERRDVYMEVVVVTTFCGALPALLGIPQDSAVWYFLNVAQWFALPPLIIELGTMPWRNAWRSHPAADGTFVLTIFLAFLILLRADAALRPRFLKFGGDLLRAVDAQNSGNLLKKATATQYTRTTLANEGRLFSSEWLEMYRRSPGYSAKTLIQEAARGRSKFAVFVPPSNKVFWNLTPSCYTRWHFLGALAGVPRLLGAPPAEQNCPQLAYAGNYGPNAYARPMSDADLCSHAAARNLDTIYILNDSSRGSENRILECRRP